MADSSNHRELVDEFVETFDRLFGDIFGGSPTPPTTLPPETEGALDAAYENLKKRFSEALQKLGDDLPASETTFATDRDLGLAAGLDWWIHGHRRWHETVGGGIHPKERVSPHLSQCYHRLLDVEKMRAASAKEVSKLYAALQESEKEKVELRKALAQEQQKARVVATTIRGNLDELESSG